jgi:uncharacterized repeat protein (TIGR03803 family)
MVCIPVRVYFEVRRAFFMAPHCLAEQLGVVATKNRKDVESFLNSARAVRKKFLYRFTGGGDGGNPEGDLIQDKSGNLYGVTFAGGDLSCNQPYGCGVAFKLDSHGNEKALYRFRGGKDGWAPYAGLIMDSRGNLYGTTGYGGGGSCAAPGCGTVFELIRNP